MSESLYKELLRLGMDDQQASKISGAFDPEKTATMEDILIMQEALLRQQIQSEQSLYEIRTENIKDCARVQEEIAKVRAEINAMRRQYWIIFAGFILTVISMFSMNWYFHSI